MSMGSTTCSLKYDPVDNDIYVWHPEPVHLEPREEIAQYFESNCRFWRAQCGTKKAYFIINFDGQFTNTAHQAFYAERVKAAMDECAIAVVRYGGEMLQRLASRMAATQLLVPSNIYRSREE